MSQLQARDNRLKEDVGFDDRVSTGRLEAAVRLASRKTQESEYQLRTVESQISTTLSNFRAIEGMMQEAFSSLEQNRTKANRALQDQIPDIKDELEQSGRFLSELDKTLPDVDIQVTEIRAMYDSGRREAKGLVENLTWLNTEFYERWRRIIFSDSPVSWRWKFIMRALFAILFLTFTTIFCLALAGAYRAHRHRLVWGDKLMS